MSEENLAVPPPLPRIVEAMLFIGGAPLTATTACEAVRGLTPAAFSQLLDELNRAYRRQGRPYRIQPRDHGYELALRPHFRGVLERLYGATREARLSPAALEVLALVAYRQPVAKNEIDSLRGGESATALRQLGAPRFSGGAARRRGSTRGAVPHNAAVSERLPFAQPRRSAAHRGFTQTLIGAKGVL